MLPQQDLTSFFPFITSNVIRGRFNFPIFQKVCNVHSKLLVTVSNKKHLVNNLMNKGTLELMESDSELANKVLDAYVKMILDKYIEMKEHAKALKNFDSYTKEVTGSELKTMITHNQHQIPPEILSLIKDLKNTNTISNSKEEF